MKILLVLITFFFISGCHILSLENHGKRPNNLYESFVYLDQMFDDTTKYSFMTLPEDVATSRMHFGLGMWMRNNWGLWSGSPLKQSLLDSGFVHPDDMSSAILVSYHRWLNGKSLRVREEADRCSAFYKDYGTKGFSAGDLNANQDGQTSMAALMKYFPVGDTIVVDIYATYDEEYASSIRGIAVVREHINDSLLIYLSKLEKEEDHKPERNEGETFKISPYYCSLIPPKNWSWMKK